MPYSFNLIVGIHKAKIKIFRLKKYMEKVYQFGEISFFESQIES